MHDRDHDALAEARQRVVRQRDRHAQRVSPERGDQRLERAVFQTDLEAFARRRTLIAMQIELDGPGLVRAQAEE